MISHPYKRDYDEVNVSPWKSKRVPSSYLLWTFWSVSASSVLLWCLNSTSLAEAAAMKPAMKSAHRVNMRNIWDKGEELESLLSVVLGGRSPNEW